MHNAPSQIEAPAAVGRLTVAIAGASGFVGEYLIKAILAQTPHRILALSRSARTSDEPRVTWRKCDLLDHDDTHEAVRGADVAVYLVHSMLPQGRGAFGHFADFDLLSADNFARAAHAQGVRQIIYLGGIIPRDRSALSAHLRSRLEVERALGSYGVPVTALRAALVIGCGGSSFRMMLRLVERLPVMFTPRWAESPCQPIAVEDVVQIMLGCLGRPEVYAGSHEIGGPDVMSYRQMMRETAEALELRRPMLPLPMLTPKLSVLWVSLITRLPRELVRPLVGSLRHAMVATDRSLQRRLGIEGRSFAEMLDDAIAHEHLERERGHAPRGGAERRGAPDEAKRRSARAQHVRGIDRLAPPPELSDARDVATAYLRWLDAHFWGHWLSVRESDGEVYEIGVPWLEQPIFVFQRDPERDGADRALLHVRGGLLARSDGGALEFRQVVDEHGMRGLILAQVEGYHPSLPRWLYRLTQEPLHQAIMRRFGHALLAHSDALLVAPACQVPEVERELAEEAAAHEAPPARDQARRRRDGDGHAGRAPL